MYLHYIVFGQDSLDDDIVFVPNQLELQLHY